LCPSSLLTLGLNALITPGTAAYLLGLDERTWEGIDYAALIATPLAAGLILSAGRF
jgi:hypothetical protein